MFASLSSFRSSGTALIANFQGGDTFNLPLAINIIKAAGFFCAAEGVQHNNTMHPLTLEFTKTELHHLNELFKTIVNEVSGGRDSGKWNGGNQEEGSAGNLYNVCKQFLTTLGRQYTIIQNGQQNAQQASEVLNLAESFVCFFV